MNTITPALEFDYEKATQVLNFFASQESGKKINKLKALKLVWVADRYHLRKYGRPIINDLYWAMEHGPVASATKDIAEGGWRYSSAEKEYADKFIETENQYTFRSIAEPDLEVFSDSDIEALKFAFTQVGHLGKYEIRDLTHIYPEWKKNEAHLKGTSRILMDYINFFENPSSSASDIFTESEEQLNFAKEVYKENLKTAELFS